MPRMKHSDETSSAVRGRGIATNAVQVESCRAVWVGVSQSLDFSFDGSTWVTFSGATAGTVIPIQVLAVRKTSGGASPDAGDVVFLY